MKDLVKIRKAWQSLGTVFTHNRKQWYFMKLWDVPKKMANEAKKIAQKEGFEATIDARNSYDYLNRRRSDRYSCIIRIPH